MKNSLIIPFMLIVLDSTAQPQFTYADFAPQAYDSYTVSNSSYFAPGNAGANQTWNFSLATTNGTATYNVHPAAAIPCGNQYPTSDVGIGTGGYEMIQRTWNTYNCVGSTNTPGQAHFIYSDPEKRFVFPMSFNNTFTDLFEGVSNATQFVHRDGFQLVSCDGFGTVITPTNTYNNALRIRRSVSWIDSFASGADSCSGDYYYWFVSGYRYPIVQQWSVNCTGGMSIGTMFLQSITIGLNELSATASFNVFPNPFGSTLTVNTDAHFIGTPLEIFDLSGRLLQTAIITTTEMKLNTEALDEGVYVLKVGGRSVRVVKG